MSISIQNRKQADITFEQKKNLVLEETKETD